MEEEYQGVVEGSCEVFWLKRVILDMKMQQIDPTTLFCDNQGVLKFAKNPTFHEHTKHVKIHFHFIIKLV